MALLVLFHILMTRKILGFRFGYAQIALQRILQKMRIVDVILFGKDIKLTGNSDRLIRRLVEHFFAERRHPSLNHSNHLMSLGMDI